MSKSWFLCGLALALCVLRAVAAVDGRAPSAAPAPDGPGAGSTPVTAEEIVARNVAARGGLAAWQAVRTLAVSGKIDAGRDPLPFVLQMKRPHKSRFALEVQGATVVEVFDGEHGWKLRPDLGHTKPQELSPLEISKASVREDIDGLLVDHAAKGSRVDLEGTDTVEGRKAYRLKVTLASGIVRHVWVDARSFLEVKIDESPRLLDGRLHRVATFLRDYRTVAGITYPYVSETVVEGFPTSRKMLVDKVAVNPHLEDRVFSKPAGAPMSPGAATAPMLVPPVNAIHHVPGVAAGASAAK
jgi:hypothetical protein